MAYATQRAVSDGSLSSLLLSIDYFERSEISVYFNNVLTPTGWAWVGTTSKQITFSPAVTSGVEVMVKRTTNAAKPRHSFGTGAQFLATTLDENTIQALRVAQEIQEGSGIKEAFNDIDLHGFRLRNLAPAVAAGDAVTLGQLAADGSAAGAVYNQFNARYMGTFGSAPTAVQVGSLYYDSGKLTLMAWDGARWSAAVGSSLSLASFSGDGATLVFNIAAAPYDENNTQVYVSGVYQQKDTYSLVGNALTFSEAPPTGASNIEVMVISALSIGTTAASTTTYAPTDGVAETLVQPILARFGSWIKAAATGVGSAAIGFVQLAGGAVLRTVQAKLYDRVSAFDFMTAAQIANVRSHTGSVDVTIALQAALDSILQTRKQLHLPAGRYLVSDTLRVHEFSNIVGEGRHFTILAAAAGMAKPVFANAAANFFGFNEWRDFGIEGGTYGVKIDVTSETAYMNFTNILILNSTLDNFYVNKLMQTSNFTDCKFSGGNRGVVCAAFTANMNNFTNCEFQNHLFEEVFFQNSEVNNFIGCEFGNVAGLSNSTGIILYNARDCNFIGCYFENGHRRLLAETSSDNSVRFDKCHFTGAFNGTYQYYFESDGTIEFGSNSWYQPSVGAPKMLVTGYNQGKLGAPTNQVTTLSAGSVFKMASPSAVYPPSAQKDLVKFSCLVADNALSTLGSLTGLLTLHYQSYNAGGFAHVMVSRRYHVAVYSAAGATLEGSAVLMSNADTLAGSTITVRVKAGASFSALTIEAVFTGNATPVGSLLGWAFESDASATSQLLNIVPSIA